MQNDTASEVAKEVENLISLPAACLKVLQLVQEPHSTSRDIEKVLKQDPSISVQVLRMANSSFYSLRNKVDTLSRAVSVIGTKRIANLVLALSAVKSFGRLTNGIISIENFWMHSIYCGLIANLLAHRSVHKQQDESLFVAGLLHDIGELVLFSKRPEPLKQALNLMQHDSANYDLHIYENQILGFTHMQVGEELAHNWGLPQNLVECIAYHHYPSRAPAYQWEASIVHIANAFANLSELNSVEMKDMPAVEPQAWILTGLDPGKTMVEILPLAKQEFEATQFCLLAA